LQVRVLPGSPSISPNRFCFHQFNRPRGIASAAELNRSLSLLAAFFSLVGCANDVLSLFNLAPYKISSLALFGPYCLLIGYLIFRSTFLPRILGVLMSFAGLGWLIFPSPLANDLSSYLKVLGFLAEASLMLWLIVKGVNVQRWKEQARRNMKVPVESRSGAAA
jgi:hypothetical protein